MNAKSILAFVTLLVASGAAQARPPAIKAEAIIAASKRATGGAAWNKPQGCYEEGTRADGAIAYKTRFSFKRYGLRVDSGRGGQSRVMGFNGMAQWQAKGDTVDVRTDAASMSEAVVTAYLSNNGFYFPDRFPASFRYVRQVTEAGRGYDIVEIAPVGGRSFEAWFDRRTHLIRRVVDKLGQPPVTVVAGDYRKAAGLTVAYRLTVLGPGGTVIDKGVVTSFRCGGIDNTIFDPPRSR